MLRAASTRLQEDVGNVLGELALQRVMLGARFGVQILPRAFDVLYLPLERVHRGDLPLAQHLEVLELPARARAPRSGPEVRR